MTALAVAGAGGGFVQPDLVLPPGFDRIGDVIRFEQLSTIEHESSLPRPSGEGTTAMSKVPGDPCEAMGATLSPATDRCGPGLAPVEQPGRIGLPGTVAHEHNTPLREVDVTPCTRCGLRGHLAGDPDRCLFYRGSLGMGGQSSQTERAR